MTENKRIIGERIFNVIKQLEMTVDKFAEALGTTKFRLYSYKAGKAEAPQSLLEEMENKYEINSRYIRKGEEPMFLSNKNRGNQIGKEATVFKLVTNTSRRIPIYSMPVAAGYPTPIEDYVEQYLIIDKLFTEKSYILNVSGDSMINADIKNGGKVLVDAGRNYKEGDIVVASIDGEATLKRLKKVGGKMMLCPENENYNPIEITEDTVILGVAIWSINELTK